MEKGTVARVLSDFLTTTEGELSLSKGDIVQILQTVDRHWGIGVVNGIQGNVPLNYLIAVETPDLEDGHELFAAIADFPGQQTGDLSFRKGELIVGTKKIDDNWWQGNIENRQGMFPMTYTWKLDSSNIKMKSKPKKLNMKAKVKMSMKAQLDEEIDLFEGEIIHVTEIIDKDWYRGSCGNKTGIFPSAYVTLLQDSTDLLIDANCNTGVQKTAPGTTDVLFDYTDLETPKNKVSSESEQSKLSNIHGVSKTELDNVDDMSILDDDYFRQNLPSAFANNLVTETFHSGNLITTEQHNMPLISDIQHMEVDISPYGVTLYPFYAQFDNELSFHEGEIVSLIRHINKDWIEGKIDGRKGIFPSSYVNIIVDCELENTSSVNDNDRVLQDIENVEMRNNYDALPPSSFAVVLYNFDAQMDSDLTVKQGEVVCVLQQANRDWCDVKNCHGKSGLCPRNYLASYTAPNKLNDGSSRRLSTVCDTVLRNEFVKVPASDKNELNKRRTFESSDFPHKWKNNSIDDLISQNLETLQRSHTFTPKINYNSVRKPLFEKVPLVETKENNTKHFEEEQPRIEEIHNRVIQEPQETLQEPEKREIEMDNVSNGNFLGHTSPLLRRQASDRLPHRPAPPIPLPGQKPVHRSIRKSATKGSCVANRRSTKLKSLISAKEKQLQETKREKNDIEIKLNSDCLEDEDTIRDMKFKIRECNDKIRFIEADLCRIKGNEMEKSVDILKKHDCVLQQQPPDDTNCGDNENQIKPQCSQASEMNEEEIRKKKQEHRQNVISELVFTEKEFVRDLKITYETFNLHNPDFLESRGINVETVFGNILDIVHVAEDLLDKLQFAMKGKDDDDQCVGPCFLELAERMKGVYGQYCMNHDEALLLLEKYESNEDVQRIFNKGLETLRYQIACFDMGSILIKPVQRILKYPLILNELIKCTEDDHKDKPALMEAVKTITEVATHINEYKRRKDIVLKYLEDGNATISQKMSRLSLHSVAKKSSRLGVFISSSLGLSSTAKDPVFQECEAQFHLLEKTIRLFMKDVETFMIHVHDIVTAHNNLGESVSYFYQERHSEVEEFSKIQRLVNRHFWKEFEIMVQKQTTVPLNTLLELFEGPSILIQKCNDKFFDYVACSAKAEKYKETRMMQEELLAAKNNYEALNTHLLEELPTLIGTSLELFLESLKAFVTARKLFSGKITKQYLTLMELPLMKTVHGDTMENFVVKHSLVLNQLARLTCLTKNTRLEVDVRKSAKYSPTGSPRLSHSEVPDQAVLIQSDSQKTYLKNRYAPDKLYSTTNSYTSKQPLELSVSLGHLVAVIKKQNPMGDSSIWFVEDGANQGFLPKSILTPHNSRFTEEEAGYNKEGSAKISQSYPSLPTYDDAVAASTTVSVQSLSVRYIPGMHQPALEVDDCKENEYEEIPDHTEHHIYSEIGYGEEQTPADTPADAPREFYYAVYDFEAQVPTTLSMKAGQVFNVLQHEDAQGNSEWWLVADRFGNKGFVPANYLAKYDGHNI